MGPAIAGAERPMMDLLGFRKPITMWLERRWPQWL